MNRKFTIIILIAIVALIGLSATYAISENDTGNKTTLIVESKKPISISEMANSIKVQPFFKNYDSAALDWLSGFDSEYVVLSTDEYYIIMNSADAAKLPKNVDTGVSVKNNITCNVLENKTLGSGLNNLLHIDNVEVMSNDYDNFNFSK